MTETAPKENFFNTAAAQITMQSLDRIVDREIIGMVVAAPGRGKTHGLKRWRKKHPNTRFVWIEADVLTSSRPILNAMMDALQIGGQRNLWDMKKAVSEALAKDPILVILDEADMMTVRTFELLRSIWDRVSELRDTDGTRGFPLALFGDVKLRDMLKKRELERLRRRTQHIVELPPMTKNEIRMVLSKKWPGLEYDSAAFDAICRMAHGSFGWLNNIVEIAMDIAARNGGRLDGDVMEATANELEGILPKGE